MDVSKLKIGDYVIVKPINKIGQVNKICTYKNPEHNKISVDLLLCDAESVEPIELTPKTAYCFCDQSSPYDIIFTINLMCEFNVSLSFLDTTIPEVYLMREDTETTITIKHIKYVHELQHLLDVFNIPYEFNLKKYENNCN